MHYESYCRKGEQCERRQRRKDFSCRANAFPTTPSAPAFQHLTASGRLDAKCPSTLGTIAQRVKQDFADRFYECHVCPTLAAMRELDGRLPGHLSLPDIAFRRRDPERRHGDPYPHLHPVILA